MQQPSWNFEQDATDEALDETGFNLRAYFDRMDDVKMQRYDAHWTDEQVITWDDNFTSEGHLFLPCSERDVDVGEYRRVLTQCLEYRARTRQERQA